MHFNNLFYPFQRKNPVLQISLLLIWMANIAVALMKNGLVEAVKVKLYQAPVMVLDLEEVVHVAKTIIIKNALIEMDATIMSRVNKVYWSEKAYHLSI